MAGTLSGLGGGGREAVAQKSMHRPFFSQSP